jgi:hypothetical protein
MTLQLTVATNRSDSRYDKWPLTDSTAQLDQFHSWPVTPPLFGGGRAAIVPRPRTQPQVSPARLDKWPLSPASAQLDKWPLSPESAQLDKWPLSPESAQLDKWPIDAGAASADKWPYAAISEARDQRPATHVIGRDKWPVAPGRAAHAPLN